MITWRWIILLAWPWSTKLLCWPGTPGNWRDQICFSRNNIISINFFIFYFWRKFLPFSQASRIGGEVPLIVKFGLRSRGEVVGKPVKTTHKQKISRPSVIDNFSTKPTKFKKNAWTYDWSDLKVDWWVIVFISVARVFSVLVFSKLQAWVSSTSYEKWDVHIVLFKFHASNL